MTTNTGREFNLKMNNEPLFFENYCACILSILCQLTPEESFFVLENGWKRRWNKEILPDDIALVKKIKERRPDLSIRQILLITGISGISEGAMYNRIKRQANREVCRSVIRRKANAEKDQDASSRQYCYN